MRMDRLIHTYFRCRIGLEFKFSFGGIVDGN